MFQSRNIESSFLAVRVLQAYRRLNYHPSKSIHLISLPCIQIILQLFGMGVRFPMGKEQEDLWATLPRGLSVVSEVCNPFQHAVYVLELLELSQSTSELLQDIIEVQLLPKKTFFGFSFKVKRPLAHFTRFPHQGSTSRNSANSKVMTSVV